MAKIYADKFLKQKYKSITLLGMSGVGKTYLSKILMKGNDWYHYSGDFRIGTRYLSEDIIDNIKSEAMKIPLLSDLLHSDSIGIRNNITVKNLHIVSSYLGKIGNPELGGLSLSEFKHRQSLHHAAEIKAMLDVPTFIDRSRKLYGYNNFINDAGGSLCELEDEKVLEVLSTHTALVYIKASKEDEERLIERFISSPKPLYFRPSFLDKYIHLYMDEKKISKSSMINPNDFSQWVFPHLFYSRIPRYENIAKKYGFTINSSDLNGVKNEKDFLKLLIKS